ncbi:MAG: extracellular solute-binding protein [Caldilineaceae bacterium]|nr:extracellular solute-binding protein [Caldilineaceae bacterium]
MSDHKLTRRNFLRLSAATGAVAALAACQAVPAAPAQEGGSAAAPSAEGVQVLYWAHTFEERVALDKEYIEKFVEENPGITVVQETPGEFNTMLPTALAAGTAGDLFAHTSLYLSEYFRQGAVIPVQFEAFGTDKAAFLDTYIEPQNTLAGATYEGELYGIPNEVSIYTLHINNTLFAEAGLDPAVDYPKTWQEFTSVAEQLTKRDSSGQLVQRGAMLGWKTAGVCTNIFGGQLHQLGGSPVSADYTQGTIDSPEATQVLEFWKYFADNGLDGPQYVQDQAQMLQGDVAMWMNTGSWRRAGLLDAGIDYTAYPAPRFDNAVNDSGFHVYAYFHMVNSQSKPDVQLAAWKLAAYLASFPGEYLAQTGLLQTKKEVVESTAFKETPFLDVFLDEMTKSVYAPTPPGWRQIVDVLDRMRDGIVEGVSIAEAQSVANEEINTVLDEAWKAIS